jgi:hypothetical protein
MRFETSLSALAAGLLLAAAAGCASRAQKKAPPPRPGSVASRGAPEARTAPDASEAPAAPEGQPVPAPEGAAPAPEGAPAPAEPAAAPAEPASAPVEEAPVPAPAPGGDGSSRDPSPPPAKGGGGAFDDFMRRTGRSLEETKFLGTRLRPYGSAEVGFTDNVFYQDEDERLVTYRDPDGDGLDAFEGDGIDNDLDGAVDEVGESLVEPRGRVDEIFLNAVLGLGFDLPLNTTLLQALGQTGQTLQVGKLEANLIKYFKESDSPDAFNLNAHLDLPYLLRLRKDVGRNSFYVRGEADFSQITDPLDVPKYQFQTSPVLGTTLDDRSDFERTEWWGKATLGWLGTRFDAKGSARYYEMTLDDLDLEPADHEEIEFRGEVGYRPRDAEQRFYAFGEFTTFDFDQRDGSTPLRDFDKLKAGAGWEGPVFSRKFRGKVEGYYLEQRIDGEDDPPFPQLVGGATRPFDDYSGPGGLARLTYRPFVTKATEFQVEYSKDFTYSLLAEHKKVDAAYASLSHPINDRLSTQVRYSVTAENVSHRERRMFHEAGLRLSYKIAAHTEVYFQYTMRRMDSQDEVTTSFADAVNEPFLARADGDFFANIVSVGISIRF